MKRILCFIFLCFFSFSIFSEEFFLFPRNTFCKEIINYFISNGWKLQLKQDNTSLVCEPTEKWYFNGFEISSISYTLDSDGYIQTQIIGLGNPPRTSEEAYNDMLKIACIYNTTFIKHEIKNRNDFIHYIYYTSIPGYDNCLFNISGVDGLYCIAFLFGNND